MVRELEPSPHELDAQYCSRGKTQHKWLKRSSTDQAPLGKGPSIIIIIVVEKGKGAKIYETQQIHSNNDL